MNLYDVLQIRPDASAEVIRAAYKALAALNHPDRDRSPEAAARFGQVQLAYETLSDDVRRAQYDAEQQSSGGKPVGQNDRVASSSQRRKSQNWWMIIPLTECR